MFLNNFIARRKSQFLPAFICFECDLNEYVLNVTGRVCVGGDYPLCIINTLFQLESTVSSKGLVSTCHVIGNGVKVGSVRSLTF